ncbi:hypothetical protein [Micromonospora sp. WMMD710]|uniref:hypothetical protein n=1 Tax=Micromonospora sp. WMMD710 TaxID=3016085 RepID=UPI0024166F54|nr:hypothetical protein [Micromonospora sp. WMMD710]MDG4762370.1 hypothetical protein [Micromonospora sp. WMMD710]MDG4762386.1 hypothetical protein [Micromonospora sp. WMMD710]MDG4762416.1 hypothetical protein [Micromonospora sp. WMMD710]MDG4762462.1 hypothetical protein [Micromonospora sp. WMMD710]MDG4762497.1 hypothetical protein [Micromonospora sp. WMMD710]
MVHVGEACSVQFADSRALRVRVISVDDRPTYPGWIWLTGYVLGPTGDALEKRELYVQHAGLREVAAPRATVTAPARRARPRTRT